MNETGFNCEYVNVINKWETVRQTFQMGCVRTTISFINIQVLE